MGMFSALFGSDGSGKRAAEAAAAGQREASKLVADQYKKVSKYYIPYQDAGQSALDQYMERAGGLGSYVDELYGPGNEILKGIDFNNFEKSPGYDFRLKEGQKALENSAAARGGLFSGATAKDLIKYGQDYATSDYDNYLRRQQDAIGTGLNVRNSAINAMLAPFQTLQPIISTGANAANANANLGMDSAKYQGDAAARAGEYTGQGILAKAKQLQAAGDQWLSLGASALSSYFGGAPIPTGSAQNSGGGGATPFSSIGGTVGGQLNNLFHPTQSIQPYAYPVDPNYMPQIGNVNQQLQNAQLRSKSSYGY